MYFGADGLIPCTPKGILELLDHYNISLTGKHVVIVGRSNLVGKPLMIECLKRDATVTVCHSKTENLSFYTRNADILVAAIGKANFIKKEENMFCARRKIKILKKYEKYYMILIYYILRRFIWI